MSNFSTSLSLSASLFLSVAQRRLRGLLLPSYLTQIRTPFGSSLSPQTLVDASVSVEGLLFPEATHELAILDLYIAAYLRERAEAAESAGFGEAANWREDLFVLYQVRLLSVWTSRSRQTAADRNTAVGLIRLSDRT